MSIESNEWKIALDRLEKWHAVLDKVGSSIFPNEYSNLYIKLILGEILALHDFVENFAAKNGSVKVLETIDDTIVRIVKSSITESKFIADKAIYDEFNDTVKDYFEEIFHAKKDDNTYGPEFSYRLSDSNPILTISALNLSKVGDRNGLFVEWWPNGAVKTIGMYKDGDPTNIWAWFDQKGRLTSKYPLSSTKLSYAELVKGFKENITLHEPAKPEVKEEEKIEEDLGLARTFLGSLAVITISSLFGNKNIKKDKLKKSTAQVQEVVKEEEKIFV